MQNHMRIWIDGELVLDYPYGDVGDMSDQEYERHLIRMRDARVLPYRKRIIQEKRYLQYEKLLRVMITTYEAGQEPWEVGWIWPQD